MSNSKFMGFVGIWSLKSVIFLFFGGPEIRHFSRISHLNAYLFTSFSIAPFAFFLDGNNIIVGFQRCSAPLQRQYCSLLVAVVDLEIDNR